MPQAKARPFTAVEPFRIRSKSSSSTMSSSQMTARPAPRVKRVAPFMRQIQTLDRHRLRSSDFQDLSGRTVIYLRPVIKGIRYPRYCTSYGCELLGAVISRIPFPSGTHGFFYYQDDSSLHLDPDHEPNLGQIHFRITASHDPAGFAAGADLKQPDGKVWYTVPRQNGTSPIWNLLVHDGFISHSDVVLARSSSLVPERRRPIRLKASLTYLDEPMLLRLSMRYLSFNVQTNSQLRPQTFRIVNPLLYSQTHYPAYQGKCSALQSQTVILIHWYAFLHL